MESARFPEPTIRRQPTALPPATRGRELPRPAPPTRALELPPRREPDAGRIDPHRTEPGTWREIIARFERELGPITEEETRAEPPPLPPEPPEAPDPEVESAEPDPGELVASDEDPSSEALIDEPDVALEPDEALDPDVDLEADTDEAAHPDAGEYVRESAKTIQPGEPPFIDEPVPWEIESMTTADYAPPHSIHDPEHDSWPVDTEDGDAVPAWSDEPDEQPDHEDAGAFDEIGELLLDEVVPADPWDREPEPDEETAPRSDFPLDAFIVPAGVRSVSGFDDEDIAHRVAVRLDELARGLRDGGLRSLGGAESVDELSRVLAAIVTGYVSRGS